MKIASRVLSILIILSMLLGCFAFTAFALETVTISVENAVPGYSVSVLADGNAITTETVTWYVSETEGGEYTIVDGAEGDNWKITNACANMYIKADVDGVKSNAIAVGAGASTVTKWQHGVTATEPVAQYSFRTADSTAADSLYYTLLDTETVDGENNYLMIQLGSSAANGTYSSNTSATTWNPDADPDTEKTMAYWLDNYWSQGETTAEVWTGGAAFTKALEGKLVPYVVDDHTWITERSAAIPNDYTFKASAAILSIAETVKYKDRLYSVDRMMLRNGHIGDTGKLRPFAYINGNNFSATTANVGGLATKYIYPIFYLNEDFFKNVKLDLSVTGADVKALILEHNNSDAATLKAIGYTDDDLTTLGVSGGTSEPDTPDTPDIPDTSDTVVAITVEKAVPGYSVTVTADGSAITDQTVTWYVSDSEGGTYEQIEGAEGDKWAITNACANKYIKADIGGAKSNAIAVGAGASTLSKWQHGAAAAKPSQYSFRVADSTESASLYYQMLDSETVDGKKQYFIVQLGESILNGMICSDSTNTKWDPTLNSADVKHLAYWLENYWSKGLTTDEVWTGYAASTKVMEEALREYVPEHTWLTERSAAVANDYIFKAHAAILSISEVSKYADKLYATDIEKMFMRSGHIADTTQKRAYSYINGNNISAITPQSMMGSTKVLPAFYLTEDFFKNVKLDLSVTGTDVRAAILEHNNSDAATLKAIGYTSADLAMLGIQDDSGSSDATSTVEITVPKAVPGYPVTVKVGGNAVTTETVTWYMSETENGTYEPVTGASGDQWQIKNACANMYIRADVNGVKSNAILVGQGVKLNTAWQPLTKPQAEIPTQYSFKVDGASNANTYYQLLDSENVDGDYQHFIIQQGATVVNGKISNNANNVKWDPMTDPTTEMHMAYWLENYFLAQVASPSSWTQASGGPINNNAGANQIETKLKDYVVRDRLWLTERNNDTVTDDYTFKAGVTILSRAEFDKYAEKLHMTNSSNMRFLLRSGQPGADRAYTYYGANNYAHITATSTYYTSWPVFYLYEDFFKNVRLNLSETGSEVKKMIVSTIPKSEMLAGNAGYTDAELTAMGYPAEVGYLENAVIAGNLAVGQRVAARYEFNDNGLGRDDSGDTRYQWYRGDSKDDDGSFTAISGADTFDYTITDEDLGKYLRVEVIAYDENGNILNPTVVTVNTVVAEELALSATFKALTDGGGTVIESISGVKAATAVYTIKNTGGNDKVTLILAVYDSNNKMIKATVNEDVDVSAGTADYSVSVTGLDENQSYTCKAMIWDDVDNMKPLSIDERK